MQKQLVWEERFNIGVEKIDTEHQKLFKIINKLYQYGEDEEKSAWVCKEGIKYFKDHAMKHFVDEEEYMESIGYSDFEVHKRIHNDFRTKTLPALEKELADTKFSENAVRHFISVCTGWMIGHTLTEDHAIAGKAPSKWNRLRPEEEYAAMGQIVLQQLNDMFNLDSKVLSESYGGEKFGEGIYYRLVYGDDKGKKWDTILVFEEKVILSTIGKMMGIKTYKVDAMLLNATRYAARQFVQRIMEYFPEAADFILRTEHLLTYEQFQKVFEKENPQFSMLLDTGGGYFAYCAMDSHFGDDVTPLREATAMAELKKYLKANEKIQKENKKKILVVDDSKVMLQRLDQLLGEDYNITSAQSGMSAIRSLTLSRPDLILLDYEMPVCDGKQVLEMIRSEQDFADISVIFLTGKVDKESVKNVLALKPDGYLSKKLNSDEIKKNIDNFFQKRQRNVTTILS